MKISRSIFPALCGIAAAVALAWFFLSSGSNSFPKLPPGDYSGIVSFNSGVLDGDNSIFLRVPKEVGRAHMIIFKDGVRGANAPVNFSMLSKSASVEPLSFKVDDTLVLLSGEFNNNIARGNARLADDTKGSWQLSPISESAKSTIRMDDSLNNLLEKRAQYHLGKKNYDDILEKKAQLKDRLEKLEQYIGDEQALKTRAEERRGQLRSQVEELERKRDSALNTVQDLAGELSALSRITERGKAATLARRVSARETKWYLANWKTEEDSTGIEEHLGKEVRVDLAKLDTAYRKAAEINILLQEVERERAKVQALERALSEPKDLIESEESQSRDKEKRKGFWQKLFGN